MSDLSRFSPVQRARLAYAVPLPAALAAPAQSLRAGATLAPATDAAKLAALFPATFGRPSVHLEPAAAAPAAAPAAAAAGDSPPPQLRVGVVLSGGQAAGGHSVIAGLFDGIRKQRAGAELIGFLNGPRGLFTGAHIVIDEALMGQYRNMGGFDIIGSGRDKIESPEQFAASRRYAEELRLDGIVVIGGDDSNTNAALLAEYFAANGCRTRVVGCPKTIDGDLKVPEAGLDISFGFDTACKTYSELIGNLCLDTLSSCKYYNFVRLMGRAASNITLECALQTHPTITLLGEEVAARKQNLASITEEIVSVIVARADEGKHYGVILVPEGLIEFVPEVSSLLKELNDLLATGVAPTAATVGEALSANNAALFAYLPAGIKKQLLAERDPHGNVQVSLIETEKLLAELVEHELARLRKSGRYAGAFATQSFFLGYEGRCGLPSDFDTAYCYALGATAAALLAAGETGMMSSVTNLGAPVEAWQCGGVPLTVMMNIERRHGKDKPVIRKWLVDLKGAPFRAFAEARARWAHSDCFRCPGPIQLDTAARAAGAPPPPGGTRVDPLCFTLALELAERAAAERAAAAGAAHAPAHAHLAHSGDIAGHRALCEGLLSSGGVAGLTPVDVQRIAVFRAAHGICDDEHYAVLAEFGVDADDWKAAEVRLARVAAGQRA